MKLNILHNAIIKSAQIVGIGALLALCAGAAQANLLKNGDFEAGDASSGDIYGTPLSWSGSFNEVSVGSCLFDSCQQVPVPRSPDQVLKTFAPFAQYDVSGTYQDVEAIPGQTYTASAWANNSAVDPLQGSNLAVFQLFFLDKSGNALSNNDVIADVDDLPTDTWVLLETTLVAPRDAAFAKIRLLHLQVNNPATGGAIFWDDASLKAVPIPASVWLFGSGLLGLIGIARKKAR